MLYYSMPKNVFKGGAKKPKRKNLKGDAKQNARLKKLERLVLPAIEYKSKDQVNPSWTVGSSGRANYPMFELEQGDDFNQRIGDKVTLMSHNVSMTLRKADSSNIIRVLWIATPSTTPLGITNVLEYGNYTTHGDIVFSSPYKRRATTSENTYKVLFDKVYHFGNDEQTKTDRYQLIPAKHGKQVSFVGVGETMPDNYQLQIIAISDSTASPNPSLDMVVRSKYIDL